MSKCILLSIHPKYVEKIINGEKQFEFRKVLTKKSQPNKIIIYSTSPVSKIVAEAEIEEILTDSPEKIWNKTKDFSGIENNFFWEYFSNKSIAIAYKLINVKKYQEPLKLKDLGINFAPQSFIYLDDHKIKNIDLLNNK